jgi:hypothetical protein
MNACTNKVCAQTGNLLCTSLNSDTTRSDIGRIKSVHGSKRCCSLQCREGLLTASVRRRDDAELSKGRGWMLRWRMRAVRHEAVHCRLLPTPVTGHHDSVQYTVEHKKQSLFFETYQFAEL